MVAAKLHSHRVTINEMRRDRKRKNDILRKDVPGDVLHQVFDTYYRNQVRALYRVVLHGR